MGDQRRQVDCADRRSFQMRAMILPFIAETRLTQKHHYRASSRSSQVPPQRSIVLPRKTMQSFSDTAIQT
jgi:hypothetical protein